MRREKPPPVQARVLDEQGNLTPQWRQWFQRIGMHFDNVRKQPDLVFTGDAALTTDDYGKVIRFDNGASDVTCTLMTATSKDIHCWMNIIRTGTGRLTLLPDSLARIEYGSLGGRFWCDEQRRLAANVTLQLITATQWGIIGATGLWKVS